MNAKSVRLKPKPMSNMLIAQSVVKIGFMSDCFQNRGGALELGLNRIFLGLNKIDF
jgi:hypothetical protein